MSLWRRIFGVCDTKPPQDPGCWQLTGEGIRLDPERATELRNPGGAIRLEGRGLKLRVLIFRDAQGNLRAVHNRCAHAGRRLDPSPDGHKLCCCSVGRSTYSPSGKLLGGTAKNDIRELAVERGPEAFIILV